VSGGCPKGSPRYRNNIPYIAPPLLTVGPQSPLPCGREIIEGLSRKGFRKILVYYYILSIYLIPTLNS
jgi:hypothetical protein